MTTPILIAHRGNISGPNPDQENSPSYLKQALDAGFKVEIDIRFIKNKFNQSEWWLGHDKPQYLVDWSFIDDNIYNIIIHAKNIITLYELSKIDIVKRLNDNKNLHFFFHDKDDCALTSFNYLWTYPNNKLPLTNRSIAVLPERVEKWDGLNECLGICTDYPYKYKENL